ncbi:MAG TPA: YigZ family protein [Thermoclostridium sp.]|nr:YigZ family protein [Thermoclostridium sp.]
MANSINTVLDIGTGEYEEKRSRFLSWIFQVNNEEQAQAHLAELKKKHYDARHHCSAYIIDQDNGIQRFSDDGEPSGTAGLPILEVIKKRQLANVLIVVVRYFGGVLLGAPGLVRAYGKAASAAVENTQIVTRELCYKTNVISDYPMYGKIRNFIDTNDFPIADIHFTDVVESELYIENDRMEFFKNQITEITGGQAQINHNQKIYAYFSKKGDFLTVEKGYFPS